MILIILMLMILPVFFLTGLTGSFFRPLAISYSLAVLVSLVVALVVTPALSLVLLRKAKLKRREFPAERLDPDWSRPTRRSESFIPMRPIRPS